MELVIRCIELLGPITESVCAGDQQEIERLAEEVSHRENEADQAKHEIRNHLPKALFLPIDRRDLLEIVHLQDSIADSLEETCHLLTLKQLTMPEPLKEDFRRLTAEVIRTCKGASEIVEHLGDLVVASFGGREAERVLGMIEAIDQPETKAEALVRVAAKSAFALEQEIGALDAMLWYQVFAQIGQIANYAERTVSRLRLLIAKP